MSYPALSFALTLGLFLGLSAGPLAARSPIAEIICEPTPVLEDRLSRQYSAERTASGVRNPEQVMEVWTRDSGDWTLVLRYATGKSCIVAMGDHWHQGERQNPA